MHYQKMTEDQRTLMHGRTWIYAKASQLQADKGYGRRRAVRIATSQYRGKLARKGP